MKSTPGIPHPLWVIFLGFLGCHSDFGMCYLRNVRNTISFGRSSSFVHDCILDKRRKEGLLLEDESENSLAGKILSNGCFRLAYLGRPRCVAVFFSQDERVQIITHVRPRKKKTPHTGVDPGKLKYFRELYLMSGLILHSSNEGDCLHAPSPMPRCS